MSEPNYAIWPIDPKFFRFYRQEEIGGYFYLVPARTLGRGQIEAANKARKEVALGILKDEQLLKGIRETRRNDLERSIQTANTMLGEITGKDKKDSETREQILRMIVLLKSTVIPDDDEATEADAKFYVETHRVDDDIYSAWIGALYIPLLDAPKVSEIWPYVPQYLLEETADFFAESRNGPRPKSEETTGPSTE